MQRIPLTQGYFTIVDDADYDLVIAAGRWAVNLCDKKLYASHSARGRTERLHTFLTGWARVDHRNGDGLDNRRSNLRPATARQNVANIGLTSTNTSGYKGVNFYRRTGRWRATVGVFGRQRHLGYFDDAITAALAYDAAAVEEFGEFARLNFPRSAAA